MDEARLAVAISSSETDDIFSESKIRHLFEKYGDGKLAGEIISGLGMAKTGEDIPPIRDLEDALEILFSLISRETGSNNASFYVVDAEAADTELTYLDVWDPEITQAPERGDILLFVPVQGTPESTPEVCDAVEKLYGCILRDAVNMANLLWFIRHEDD